MMLFQRNTKIQMTVRLHLNYQFLFTDDYEMDIREDSSILEVRR